MDPLQQIDRVMQLVGEQPELFPIGQELGLELGIVQAATALCSKFGADAYSGKISTADERKCAAVLLGLQAGIPKRQIREKVGVHMYTIDAVESAAMRGGKLEPLNIRVRDELSRLVLDAAAESRSALQSDNKDMESSAWLKGVATMLGISFDKNQLSIGAPTEIFEQRSGPGREAVAAWLESQGVVSVLPMGAVDVSSPESTPKSLVVNGPENLTTQVHTPEPLDSLPQVPDLEPADPAPAPAEHPGGGVSHGAGATTVHGSTSA